MKNNPLLLSLTSAALLICGPAVLPVSAQYAVPPAEAVYQPLSDQQLDQLLGPIALYPDPLLAEMLPAATFPLQIVMADRYLASGGNPNEIDYQPWDDSVKAVARYPAVLKYMDDNLAWTTQLGQAFLNQEQQVMESIQRLRISARNFGNLVSTPQQDVVYDDGQIEILPIEPDYIYVPVYQPSCVYYRAGFCPTFGVGCTIGPWLGCDFDWHGHNLFFWGHDHMRPAFWWRERPAFRLAWMEHRATIWRPEDHRNFDGDHRGFDWGHRTVDGAHHDADVNLRGDHNWQHRDDHNDSHFFAHDDPAHNSSVVWMSKPGSGPRPAATPRPMVDPRMGGTIHVVTPPAPPAHPVDRGTPSGGNGWHNDGNNDGPGHDHDNRSNTTRPDYANAPRTPPPGHDHFTGGGSSSHSAPPAFASSHSEPVHNEPVHSEPAHSEPSHSAPSSQGSSNSGGGGNNNGGGSHGSGSSSRH